MTKGGRGYNTIAIGPFGYCDRDGCSGAKFGYDLDQLLTNATSATTNIVQVGTKSFIIIPITAVIAFLGLVVSASGHHIGSAIISAICGVIVSATSAIAIGLVNFTLVAASRSFGNTRDASSRMGHGRWMLVAACGFSSFCWIMGIIECCLARQHKKRARDVEYVPVGVTPIGQQTMGYGQKDVSAGLIANQAPMGVDNYRDPYVDQPIEAKA